jgi:hypothetical protein
MRIPARFEVPRAEASRLRVQAVERGALVAVLDALAAKEC